MAVFTPPTQSTIPPVYLAPDSYRPVPKLAQRLFRYFGTRPEGTTVFKLVDGSYTTTQPYPYLDASVYPADEATVLVSYVGGRSYDVTADEAAALTAAGFGSYIS